MYTRNINGNIEFIEDNHWVTLQTEKKASWFPLTVDKRPVPTPTQIIVDTGIVFEETQARQTWAVRDLTEQELERIALKDERERITSYLLDLNAQLNTGNAARALLTNNQRINELERDTRILMKSLKYLLRSAK